MNANMNPFMSMDMSKMMADLDPAKFADNFAKLAGGFAMPEFDMNALVDAQRKNVEALNAVNKAAVEGIQTLAQRQNEIIQEMIKEATDAVAEFSKIEGPEEAAAKQAEYFKGAFEKAVNNSQALAEVMATSNTETSKLINKRITESLDEVRKQALALKKKK
jgi:phasin family protein